MFLNVSDLYDDLFSIATVAQSKFPESEFSESKTRGTEDPSCWDDSVWQDFCQTISDSFFLPMCSKRFYEVTGQLCPAEQLQRRIIVQNMTGKTGLDMWYCRPSFFYSLERPNSYVVNYCVAGHTSQFHAFAGEDYQLMLYVGRLAGRLV